MSVEFVSFRVEADFLGLYGKETRVDNFELRQAAITCCRMADAIGAKAVRCFLVTREKRAGEYDEDELSPVEWREAALP